MSRTKPTLSSRLVRYVADHTFQAIVNALFMAYFLITLPQVLHRPAHAEDVGEAHAQQDSEQPGDQQIVQSSQQFGDSVIGNGFAFEELGRSRLAGEWVRHGNGRSYVWEPYDLQLEIPVEGGKLVNASTELWHFTPE